MNKAVNSLIIIIVFILNTYTDTLHVRHDAAGLNNGTDWQNAWSSLHDAIINSKDGDQIWVAAGIYTPCSTFSFSSSSSRLKHFKLKKNVAIYGGFTGNETDFNSRNWINNKTILSGDLNNDDGDNFLNTQDNCYHVFYHEKALKLDSTSIIDGFFIMGGNANSQSGEHGYGGGILNYGADISINNVIFAANQAQRGAAIYNSESSPSITDAFFMMNKSTTYGGAIFNHNSYGNYFNVSFNGNSAKDGGALANFVGGPLIVNGLFTGNEATGYGGAIYNNEAYCYFYNITVSGNEAAVGGGIVNLWQTRIYLENTIVWKNFASSQAHAIATLDNSLGQPSWTHAIHCIVEGIDDKNHVFTSSSSMFYDSINNISNDPLFIDPVEPNEAPSIEGNYRLSTGSPAIDAGTNEFLKSKSNKYTIDISGNSRYINDKVDIGTYEYVNLNTTVRQPSKHVTSFIHHRNKILRVDSKNADSFRGQAFDLRGRSLWVGYSRNKNLKHASGLYLMDKRIINP